jgi:hypothetical protein
MRLRLLRLLRAAQMGRFTCATRGVIPVHWMS